MTPLRTMARAAPRALSVASATISPAAPGRTSAALARAAPLLRSRQAAAAAAAFSTSPFRSAAVAKSKGVDTELITKLDSEIKFEKDMAEAESVPTSIDDFLKNSPFKVQDTPGNEKVVMTRNYENEKITVEFSISDMHDFGNEGVDEDDALTDEDYDGDDGQLAEPPAKNQQKRGGRAAEQEEDDLDEELEDETDEDGGQPMPSSLNIVIEKPGKGAMRVIASAVQGSIVVENVFYYNDAKLAKASGAEQQANASEQYGGPPFGTLDEDLQLLMERYLEDRGISQAMAYFVPQYMEMKEQKEYLTWLSNIKSFVAA